MLNTQKLDPIASREEALEETGGGEKEGSSTWPRKERVRRTAKISLGNQEDGGRTKKLNSHPHRAKGIKAFSRENVIGGKKRGRLSKKKPKGRKSLGMT